MSISVQELVWVGLENAGSGAGLVVLRSQLTQSSGASVFLFCKMELLIAVVTHLLGLQEALR